MNARAVFSVWERKLCSKTKSNGSLTWKNADGKWIGLERISNFQSCSVSSRESQTEWWWTEVGSIVLNRFISYMTLSNFPFSKMETIISMKKKSFQWKTMLFYGQRKYYNTQNTVAIFLANKTEFQKTRWFLSQEKLYI